MKVNYKMPPDPQHAVLKKIYPWDEYDITLVMQWLFTQAAKTGFTGTFEDFKQRYGAYVDATDPQDMQDLIENYQGSYHITPLVNIEQILRTKNKILNEDIIIDPIPDSIVGTNKVYHGSYSVTPMAYVDQLLRTGNKIMEDDLVVEKIPTHKTTNEAGGYTFTIG